MLCRPRPRSRRGGQGAAAAHHFERRSSSTGSTSQLRFLRGRWRRMLAALLVYAEIEDRRRTPTPSASTSSACSSTSATGNGFADKEAPRPSHDADVRGHDTATSTLTFMMYECPDVIERLQAEQGRGARWQDPRFETLERGLPRDGPRRGSEALPLRLGPRRAVREFEFNGKVVPRRAVSTMARGRVIALPESSRPRRLERASSKERKAALPRGADTPSAAASASASASASVRPRWNVATMLLQRLRLDLMPWRTMSVRQTATLSPRGLRAGAWTPPI